MSNILQLPLYQARTGVESDEDWTDFAFEITLSDGVTPLSLAGITFALYLTPPPYGFTPITGDVSGVSNNVLSFFVPQAQKTNWYGCYALSILATATDSGSPAPVREMLADSTLTINQSQVLLLTQILQAGSSPSTLMSPIPAALAAALANLNPAVLAAAMAALPANQLSALANALIASLPVQTAGGACPVSTGQAFTNSDGFVVIAQ